LQYLARLTSYEDRKKHSADAALQKKMPGICRTLSKANLKELHYFLLFSTMSSIPVLDNLMAITTPSEKIIIGTNSSIGISLPLGYVRALVKKSLCQK
jgi:hypothetical protein